VGVHADGLDPLAPGLQFDGAQTLTEQWDGSSWTVLSTPGSAGADGDSLLAVHCGAGSECTSVGFHGEVVCNCANGGGVAQTKPAAFISKLPRQAASLVPGRIAMKTSKQPLHGTNNVLVLHAQAGSWQLQSSSVALLPSPLRIGAVSLLSGTRGSSYETQLRAGGGTAPYQWAKSGSWPIGLSISRSGLISGTPATKLKPGTYVLGVKVSDATKKRMSTSASFSLTLR
jgi:hypothetical protein